MCLFRFWFFFTVFEPLLGVSLVEAKPVEKSEVCGLCVFWNVFVTKLLEIDAPAASAVLVKRKKVFLEK